MGTVITFPSERCSAGTPAEGHDGASVIILPVIRIERFNETSDNFEPNSSSPRGKRRKR